MLVPSISGAPSMQLSLLQQQMILQSPQRVRRANTQYASCVKDNFVREHSVSRETE